MCSCSLDRKEHFVCRYGVFKVQRTKSPMRKTALQRTVSQNSAAIVYFEVDVILGDLVVRTKEMNTEPD